MFTLTTTVRRSRSMNEYTRDGMGLPVVADTVRESVIIFQDMGDLVDYLAYKGVSPERAALVIGRGCAFSTDDPVGDDYTHHRVTQD